MKTLTLCASALPLALVVAACSPSGSDAEPAPGETTVAAPAASETPAPAPAPTATGPVVATTIPAAFHGTWDYIKGTCDPQSDARQTVSANGIEFYESHGDVTRVEIDSPSRVVVTLAMAGEGETWQTSTLYSLSADGNRLTTQGVTEDENPAFELKRCS